MYLYMILYLILYMILYLKKIKDQKIKPLESFLSLQTLRVFRERKRETDKPSLAPHRKNRKTSGTEKASMATSC